MAESDERLSSMHFGAVGYADLLDQASLITSAKQQRRDILMQACGPRIGAGAKAREAMFAWAGPLNTTIWY